MLPAQASGDADHYIVRFYRAFPAYRCEPSHLSLFRRTKCLGDRREYLLGQDLIYVGGGSVTSLIGVWRAHGVDRILREAWERGIVLCGLSAGSLCWFTEGVSTFHGPPERIEGLGLLPWSNTVHYSSEPEPREAYHGWLRDGMRPGYAVDDGAALHFVGTVLAQVVASRPTTRAHRIERQAGRVVGTQIATRYLAKPRRDPAGPPGRRGGPRGRSRVVAMRSNGRPHSPASQPVDLERRLIFAIGGHEFSRQRGSEALRDYMLGLSGAERPRVCLLPTASGDPADQIAAFKRSLGDLACEPSHVSLFRLEHHRIAVRDHLLSQDVIYVGGGSLMNLLAVSHTHGIDRILRLAWERGIVLCGQSAGAICWFEFGITCSGGAAAAHRGLGWLPGSFHYARDSERRGAFP